MFKSVSLLPLAFSLAALSACVPDTNTDSGDLALDEGVSGIGKADHVTVAFEELRTNIGQDRLNKGGRAIITSPESFEDYFGTQAPDNVDFDKEWVAFYGLGARNTGGFSANITSVIDLPYWGGMLLEINDTSPGSDCFVTQAITFPFTLVKFPTPKSAPTWFAVDSESTAQKCGPDNNDRLDELAVSAERWQQARDAAGNSYTYTSEFQSFTGFGGRTTLVVDDGLIVERHYKAQHISGGDSFQWSEFGSDVGSHDEGASPVLIDQLYTQCEEDVLTKSEDDHWINLVVDSRDGLMRSCTSTHRECQDDCARGANIATITFD